MSALATIVSWAVFGLVVGAVARFILPGRQSMGLLTTIILGIAGSFVGGYLSHLLTHGVGTEIQSSSVIWSVVGAIVLLLGYSWVSKP